MTSIRWLLVGFWLVLVAFPAPAQNADTYPSHAVKVIVPFPPGGITDLMARILAQKLSVKLAQSFYIENHGGGGGNIGTLMAAQAVPDGYTLLITSSALVLNPVLQKVAYDPVESFEAISVPSTSPTSLVVHPRLKAHSVGDLIELIKKEKEATYASAGIGTVNHLAGELFRLSTGLEITHIPFPGAGPALSSVVGGHTPIAFLALPSVTPFMREKSVRVLAVTSATRWSATPEIPTLSELGFSDVVPRRSSSSWRRKERRNRSWTKSIAPLRTLCKPARFTSASRFWALVRLAHSHPRRRVGLSRNLRSGVA